MYDLDTSLRVLLFACVICIAFIVLENRRMRACMMYGGGYGETLPKKEPFVPPPSSNSMREHPLQPVEAAALESYDFGDIEAAFTKIGDKITTMKDTSMKFIEARDIVNVVRGDTVVRS